MWRWIWGETADVNDLNAQEEECDSREQSSQSDHSDADENVEDIEVDISRAVLLQLRELQRRHDKYAGTVDDLCKKVDNLLEQFRPGVVNGGCTTGDCSQSIANQLHMEMSKLKVMVDKMGGKKNEIRDPFPWLDCEYEVGF